MNFVRKYFDRLLSFTNDLNYYYNKYWRHNSSILLSFFILFFSLRSYGTVKCGRSTAVAEIPNRIGRLTFCKVNELVIIHIAKESEHV